MPNPKVCNKIKDPAARRRCLNYEGEFAKQGPSVKKNNLKGSIPQVGGGPESY